MKIGRGWEEGGVDVKNLEFFEKKKLLELYKEVRAKNSKG